MYLLCFFIDYNTRHKKISVFIALLLGIITAIGQPVNDDFANAIDITHLMNDCSAKKAFTNTGATMDKNYGSCWTSKDNGENVWFSFTAPATGQINVKLKTGNDYGTIRNTEMALWDNSGINELKCMKWSAYNKGVELSYIGLTPGETYYISINNYGNSYAGSFALCLDDKVNYDYFEIEKSKDGIFFTSIAKIDGHGNSSTTHHYFTEDTQPYCGISYYRLKQKDYDGTTTTHPIVTVNKTADKNIFIYPVPASHVLHYTVSPELVGATAILVDVLGKEIKNNIIISNEKGHIYVDDVPSGTYQLRMFTDEVQQNIKIQINN